MAYCPPNSYEFTYLDSPEFYILSLHFTAFFAVPIYIFTGFLIVFKTPQSMKSVKFSLLTFHCWTCFVDVVFSILVSPFALAPLYAGYPMGVLQWMGVGIQHQAIFSMASTEAMLVSIIGVYENRFYILTHFRQWWGPVRIPWYIFNYFLALAAFWPVYYLVPDQTNARESVILQLLVPSFCLNAPFAYIWYSAKFKYYNQKLTNFSIILIASHGLFSSIFMLFIQIPYRKVVWGYCIFWMRGVGIRCLERSSQEDKSVFQSRMSKIVLY
ncbi:hypothetical protein CAEBREN_20239 [Caenorhabditis brenneri]|uniref:Serpentine Receptor, class H n=1 Tax=Caenorhabditis brenneri TaxID=135651 RepID=G0MW14_CAEBE|nr:hypothetical protein CAEBREN_20239 [Caenorhabditis brenneri]